jgi:hypothetical protein
MLLGSHVLGPHCSPLHHIPDIVIFDLDVLRITLIFSNLSFHICLRREVVELDLVDYKGEEENNLQKSIFMTREELEEIWYDSKVFYEGLRREVALDLGKTT